MLLHFESHPTYKRHDLVSKVPGCVPNTDFALAEYIGIFPGRSAHGNATKHARVYYRTPGPVMEDIGKLTQSTSNPELYTTSFGREQCM